MSPSQRERVLRKGYALSQKIFGFLQSDSKVFWCILALSWVTKLLGGRASVLFPAMAKQMGSGDETKPPDSVCVVTVVCSRGTWQSSQWEPAVGSSLGHRVSRLLTHTCRRRGHRPDHYFRLDWCMYVCNVFCHTNMYNHTGYWQQYGWTTGRYTDGCSFLQLTEDRTTLLNKRTLMKEHALRDTSVRLE